MRLHVNRPPEDVAAADALPWEGFWARLMRPMTFDSIVRAFFAIGGLNLGTALIGLTLIPVIPNLTHLRLVVLLVLIAVVVITGLISFGIPLLLPAIKVRRSAARFFGLGVIRAPLSVTIAIFLIGPPGDLLAILYPMSMTLAFYVVRSRVALLGAVLAIAQYGLLLALQPGHVQPLAKWLMTSMAILGTSAAVGWIASRADRARDEANEARAQLAASNHELAELNAHLEQRVAEQVQEVRDSRARIVAASDESRRRIERNIHDGAQQQLVAISLDLRILAEGVEQLPPAAVRSELEQAHGNLKEALDNLRELARGLHPPVLTTDGLAVALEQLAGRAPLPVRVNAPPGRYPEGIETAVYFIAAEILANTAKHAEATKAGIDVTPHDGALTVVLSDDGKGGAGAVPGGGLAGLADRVAALDGTLTIDSHLGEGTTITVSLPGAP